MELVTFKNNDIFLRTIVPNDNSEYTFAICQDAPPMPSESAGEGKEWILSYNGTSLIWVAVDREKTIEEQVNEIREELDQQKYAWKSGEVVVVGDRRYYNGNWYTCLQSHTTQADWTPDVVSALWALE